MLHNIKSIIFCDVLCMFFPCYRVDLTCTCSVSLDVDRVIRGSVNYTGRV